MSKKKLPPEIKAFDDMDYEKQGNKKTKSTRTNRIISNILIVVFASTFLYSAYKLYSANQNYVEEAKFNEQIKDAGFRPDFDFDLTTDSITDPTPAPTEDETPLPTDDKGKVVRNPSIVRAKREITEDFVGWLVIPNTKIDYAFMQGADNEKYLRTSIYGTYLFAGSLFLDYRCANDFSNFNSIIYGHSMNNGSMFGQLKNFKNANFFNNNPYGKLAISSATYTLEIFAYIDIPADDDIIYGTIYGYSNSATTFLEYVKTNARHYRELNLTENDHILTLSTCGYDFDGHRIVVLARIV